MANEGGDGQRKKESLRLLDQTVIVNGHKISIADIPDQTVTINQHKISVAGLSERSSIISALAIREEHNFTASDDILNNFGICNSYILFILLSLATCWSLSIVNVMCAVFYETGLSCNANDKECLDEKWKMFTIEDQFHIHENSWLSIEWTTTIFFIGDFFGGVSLSILSDIIGRRAIVFPSILLLSLFGILSTYAQTYYSFLVVRFFEGFFFTSSAILVWTFATECVSVRNHSRILLLFGCFWVFGYCSVLLIAKLVPDWRQATMICCVPTAILSVILWVLMPDSFHFLAEHSRAKQLKNWLYRADKNSFEVALFTRILKDRPVQHNFRRFSKFLSDNSVYIRYMFLSSLIWIINFLAYFGNSIYSVHLGGNAYHNYLLSGLIELPALFAAPFLLDKFGRKRSFILASLFNACCFGILVVVNHSNRQLFIPIWLLAKMGSSSTFNFMLVYNSEIFPTIIRNTAMGMCAVSSNFGAALGPHVFYTASLHRSMPWLIFGTLSIVSALAAFGLPETKPSQQNKPLVVITSDER